MNNLITHILAGLAGGAVRAIVGWRKERRFRHGAPWRWSKAKFTLLTSAVIGAFAAALLYQPLALLAGYAGTDFIEGMYTAKFGKNIGR